uniref:Uncharacterized protein n=1 Tax=Plectus sambesii TaxID=2011161 RepID=A0A914VJU7_9BILA
MPAIVLCPPGQFIKGRAIAVLFDQEGKNELLLDELLSMEADSCLWFGRSCNVTSVWTVNGKCFRIAPENSDDEITDSFGNGKVVQFLIDTLKFNFPFKVPMVYLYQMNETGFAMKDGGFNIEPGKFTQLAISQTRQNIRAKQNCSRMDLKHFGDKWKYTKEKCEWEMSTSMIEEKCNCTSDLAPNYSFITDDQIFCLTHADSKCGDSGMWGGEQFSVIANRQQKFFDNDSNYCSFADAFYCAPKHLELNEKFNCPDNCFEITYDIDLVTSAIDIVKVAESVPGQNFLTDDCGGCASSMDNNLKGVHAVDDFRTMPGAKQLYHMINKLFQNYLQLLNAFWWKADESPYYPAFFKMFSNGDMDDNAFSFEKYIEDGGLRLGCLPDDFTFFT